MYLSISFENATSELVVKIVFCDVAEYLQVHRVVRYIEYPVLNKNNRCDELPLSCSYCIYSSSVRLATSQATSRIAQYEWVYLFRINDAKSRANPTRVKY